MSHRIRLDVCHEKEGNWRGKPARDRRQSRKPSRVLLQAFFPDQLNGKHQQAMFFSPLTFCNQRRQHVGARATKASEGDQPDAQRVGYPPADSRNKKGVTVPPISLQGFHGISNGSIGVHAVLIYLVGFERGGIKQQQSTYVCEAANKQSK